MTLHIDDRDLKRALAKLEGNIRAASSKALKAGSEPISRDAKSHLKRRAGKIPITVKTEGDEAVIEAKGVDARIREFGGTIRAKSGRYLVFKNKAGEVIRTPSVRIPARPYMRPAVDENKDRIASEVGKVLGDAARSTR